MKGIVKHKEDNTWVVQYEVWDDERTYELPLLPESLLIVRLKPDMEVNFKEIMKDDKVYAKLNLTEEFENNKTEFDVKRRVDELMRNNIKIKTRLGKDCEICGEHIDDWNKPICVGCLEAIKELVLERKEYIKKYK